MASAFGNEVAMAKFDKQVRLLLEKKLIHTTISFEGARQSAIQYSQEGKTFEVVLPPSLVGVRKFAICLTGVNLFGLNGQWENMCERDGIPLLEQPYVIADPKTEHLDWSNVSDELGNLDRLGRRPATFLELLHCFSKDFPPKGCAVFALGSFLNWGLGPKNPYPYISRKVDKMKEVISLGQLGLGPKCGETYSFDFKMLTVLKEGAK